MRKVDLIKQLVKVIGDNDSIDMLQDTTGYIESTNTMDSMEIVRIILDVLNKKGLLVPLLIKAWTEDLIGWPFIDTIAGNYAKIYIPALLNKMNKAELQQMLKFYEGE